MFLHSVEEGIRDGTIIMTAGDYPRFLYPDGKKVAITDIDLFEGFLLSDILIKVSLHFRYRLCSFSLNSLRWQYSYYLDINLP